MLGTIQLEYDVFISYSHHDKDWVRNTLLPHLESAGLKVFIDFRDFKIGAPSIKEMERGIVISHKTIIVLTPEYLDSEWAEFETLITQTLSPANKDLRLLPILKTQCTLPVSIGYMNYVNFADADNEELQWQRLIKSIGHLEYIPRVILVDDEPDVQKTIGGLLEDNGYKVYPAEDEDSAFTILGRKEVDFAVIDIHLHDYGEDEGGLNLAKAIHTFAPQIQVIILSGYGTKRQIIRSFKELGVVDFIEKTPDMGQRLLKTIKELSVNLRREISQ